MIVLLFVGVTITTNLSAATGYTPVNALTVSGQGNGLVVGVHSLVSGGRGITEGFRRKRVTSRSHIWRMAKCKDDQLDGGDVGLEYTAILQCLLCRGL